MVMALTDKIIGLLVKKRLVSEEDLQKARKIYQIENFARFSML